MLKSFLLTLASILITACATLPARQGTAYDQMQHDLKKAVHGNQTIDQTTVQNTLPNSIKNALMPPISTGDTTLKPKRFDVAVKNVPAKSFFMGLVANSPDSMVVSPDIKGNVSLDLKNVTLDEVMQTVREVYGFEYERTAYGYVVTTNRLTTQTFNVNYLDVLRAGQTQTSTTSGQISEKYQNGGSSASGSSTTSSNNYNNNNNSNNNGNEDSPTTFNSRVTTRSQVDFWKELKESIEKMLSYDKAQSVTVIPSAGLVTVRAYPKSIREIGQYLDQLQNRVAKQVILEAKILEVTLKDAYQAGIDWSILDINTQQTALQSFPGTDINFPFSNIFSAQVKGDFSATIQALTTQGNVQVLSSPHISTMNNQKAVIKVGTDEFFVTGVSTTSTVVGNTAIPDQNIELTPFFSGINLDVTPQIGNRGVVTLHIHPSVSTVRDQTKTLTLNDKTFQLPLALSDIRETDTIVRARNGQVVVIGGLMQNSMNEDVAATPVLGQIPYAGGLFRHTKQNAVKSELVILLRPMVVENKSWNERLQQTQQSLQTLDRGFHVGSKFNIFGTQAESDYN